MLALKLKYSQLEALNTTWTWIKSLKPKNAKEKAMLSAMQELSEKFQKKQISLQYKYDPTRIYNIKMADHEAYFLEMYLRDIIQFLPYGYNRNAVNQITDFINQKLA